MPVRSTPAAAEPDWKSPALALVNSEHWFGRGPGETVDQLDSPDWLRRYLDRWGLNPDRSLSSSDVDMLAELRGLLRRLVAGVVRGDDIQRDLERLRPYVENAPLRRRIEIDSQGVRIEYAPARRDPEWVLAEIAASFVELLEDGRRARIKLCANEECGWVFYDESRNRRRRWCDMQICGNVDKVRRFRARQAGVEA